MLIEELPQRRTNTESRVTAKRSPVSCPQCGSEGIVPALHGMSSPEMFERSEQGKIQLGGCVVGDAAGDPNVGCNACRHRWIAPDPELRRVRRKAR